MPGDSRGRNSAVRKFLCSFSSGTRFPGKHAVIPNLHLRQYRRAQGRCHHTRKSGLFCSVNAVTVFSRTGYRAESGILFVRPFRCRFLPCVFDQRLPCGAATGADRQFSGIVFRPAPQQSRADGLHAVLCVNPAGRPVIRFPASGSLTPTGRRNAPWRSARWRSCRSIRTKKTPPAGQSRGRDRYFRAGRFARLHQPSFRRLWKHRRHARLFYRRSRHSEKRDALFLRQVKLHGYRIELDDVERNLLALPGIAQGAVLAEQDYSGAVKRLRAFAVLQPIGLRGAQGYGRAAERTLRRSLTNLFRRGWLFPRRGG